MRRFLKIIGIILLVLLLCSGAWFIYAHYFIVFSPPSISDKLLKHNELNQQGNVRQLDQNWLRHDSTGIWEMYIEGQPFDRGQALGLMAEDLLDFQEKVFVDQVETMVPNQLYKSFLLHAIKYYNRDLDDYIPAEFKREIYGVSLYAPKAYSHLGSNYQRKLSYHASHDIGHAFQNMGFVSGCTAMGVLDSAGDQYLGRNFDFYVGDDFAKNKIVMFMRPDSGYAFVSLTWAGMMGVVSGMNEKGLAVVLNAGPSEMPKGARTPVTLIAREIIQYAETIDEALAIAKKRDVFVSENFILASGAESRIVTIEKSPGATVLVEGNPQQFICTNHFVSDENKTLESNIEAQTKTSSKKRFDQMQKLLSEEPVKDAKDMAKILRTTSGLNGESFGLGNELAINQLIGHHSIIFNINKKQVFIAGVPSQSGPYLKYDLDEIFSKKYKTPQRLWIEAIPKAELLNTKAYADFLLFRTQKEALIKAISDKKKWSKDEIKAFIQLNPDHYIGYKLVGEYYTMAGDTDKARFYFEEALSRPIPWAVDREDMENKLQ